LRAKRCLQRCARVGQNCIGSGNSGHLRRRVCECCKRLTVGVVLLVSGGLRIFEPGQGGA
jgi:hypothetical protein